MKQQLIYGVHAVTAVLQRAAKRVHKVCINIDRADKRLQDLRQLAFASGVTVVDVSAAELANMAPDAVHQGVVAWLEPLKSYTESDLETLVQAAQQPPFIVILDGITDPHNLGACLRAADAAGVDFVVIPKDKNATITPVVSKVASGAAEFMPVVRVTNLARSMQKLKQLGVWIFGTHLEAQQSLFEQDLTGPCAIVMGSEGAGMRRLTATECDVLCDLPMHGTVGSLNVAVACGVCVYEVVRQRRQ